MQQAVDPVELQPTQAMPDEEEIARIARRNASRRGGGRASTVLTGGGL
jgi:hypothetical protein